MTAAHETMMQNFHPVQLKSAQCKRFVKREYKHYVYKIWHRCYVDMKDFNQDKLLLSQNDILKLCASKNVPVPAGIYIMPERPDQPLSQQNALIVDKNKRKYLLALWRMTKDPNIYIRDAERYK
jgi:hypothetical protein